ncbi:MAG: hypothetical protein Q7S58_05140 [Candidatus Binatus sp.]|uniref:hypothetical protein n=1 Tax=Candidatus Binatus sp. TaxID=2811406 RepID=UPI002726DB17|nr:hypothetical protein [Candidatus Binatus sp.]MDO8431778.1 hypothetical protein [Candidatus Binatus sp.]
MPYDADDERIVYLSREKLVALLGEEETGAVLKKYGGTRVRVPREETPAFDDMVCLIGEASTRALSSAHAGSRILLPQRPSQTRPRIFALLARGLSTNAIARKLKLTTRHVQRVISEERRRLQ